MTNCSVPECPKPSRSKGLCKMHYSRVQRHGSTVNLRPDLNMTTEERFWAKVNVAGPDACWEWTGAKGPQGHGIFRADGENITAYRWLWIQHNGPVPEGQVIDHGTCDNPPCVNPAHLRPLTIGANVLRGTGTSAVHSRKTECDYGHPLSGENLRIQIRKTRNGRVTRVCRTCERRRESERRARRKAMGSRGTGANSQARAQA